MWSAWSTLALAACGSAPASPSSPVVERQDVHSVPELLASLPEALRARRVLMRRSRSPQPASDDAPRVILYSADARLVVAFDGASESVDVMTFDDPTSTFSFREVTFPEVGGRPTMSVSEPNPARCRACHGTPARPIWDAYPLWPGAYEETEGGPLAGDVPNDGALASHPRYRYLPPLRRETAIDGAERRYLGLVAPTRSAELTSLLGALNAKAVAAELRASPRFDRYRYALLAALIPRCTDVLETSLRDPGGTAESFATFEAETRRANAEEDQAKSRRTLGQPPSRPLMDDRAMTRLRYVAERALGVRTRTWTLALEKGSYDFTSSAGRASGFEAQLFGAIAGSDERLSDLYWQGSDPALVCAYLDQHDRAARRRTAASPSVTTAGGEPGASRDLEPEVLLAVCASCHEQGVGPPIPFRDRGALASRLASPAVGGRSLLEEIRARMEPAAGAGRMPLTFVPSARSRAQLLAYLVDLAGPR